MIEIEDVVWNEQNIAHIARHGVTVDEVNDVVFGDPVPSQTYAGRIRLIGLTTKNRMLTVILYPRTSGVYYLVTARSASKKERAFYRSMKGGEQAA